MGKVVHNNYITIAKAIGIILMVIGHSGCPLLLFRFIYLFHMPLFFICSGIFFGGISTKDDAFVFFNKRVHGLYLPFVGYSVFFLLIHNLLMIIGVYNSQYGYYGGSSFYGIKEIFYNLGMIMFTMHGYEELLGGFWFIRTLFISSILVIIVSLLLSGKYKQEIMCLTFLFSTLFIRRFFSDYFWGRELSMATFGAMFFLLGKILMQYVKFWKNKYIGVVCVSFLLLSMLYFNDTVKMECGYNKVLPFVIVAVSGFLLTLYISDIIEKRVTILSRMLYYIGNNTLIILALHFLCFRAFSYIIVLFYNLDMTHVAEHPYIQDIGIIDDSWWWMLYSLFGLCVPLIFSYIKDRLTTILV